MKFCKDCEYFIGTGTEMQLLGGLCGKTSRTDPVLGNIVRTNCSDVREIPTMCGLDGRWFRRRRRR